MTDNEKEITVLCRMAIPLVDLAKKSGIFVKIEITNLSFEFYINVPSENDENVVFDYIYNFETTLKDRNAIEDSDCHLRFRTVESMKEILWSIKEALEC